MIFDLNKNELIETLVNVPAKGNEEFPNQAWSPVAGPLADVLLKLHARVDERVNQHNGVTTEIMDLKDQLAEQRQWSVEQRRSIEALQALILGQAEELQALQHVVEKMETETEPAGSGDVTINIVKEMR